AVISRGVPLPDTPHPLRCAARAAYCPGARFFRLQPDPDHTSWVRLAPFPGKPPMNALSRRQFLATAAAFPAVLPSRLSRPPADLAKLKLGLVTYNVPKDWDLPTILKVCKEVGIAAVECRTTHKHGVEPTLSAEQRKDVKKQFADSGVVFWGCGSVCEFHSADPAVVKKNIEDCKQFVKLVQDIGGGGGKERPKAAPRGAAPDRTIGENSEA